ncbi:hypothetical protein EDD18DRAFT_1080175 [Armillaria luteobubalina]|uniref:Hemolytic lectin LSLb n=1 Tax=Armillaria luteobubalina TaxID=153913 RepID=A0AA39PX04_9AGAR|nr:hypothetical protein EDD18DRAFT_1080175 [Armillaria luteobubalina]
MYIPPEGLYFRLTGVQSQHVLYSRLGRDPEVWHYKGDSKSDDQLFSLIHGTGEQQGFHAIKGKKSGKVLYSRLSPDPQVGHVDEEDMDYDSWFDLEVGAGEHRKHFRIVCPVSGEVLFSRTNKDPHFGNYTRTVYSDDQWFTMDFEDMAVKSVDYDIAQGKILNATPHVLANQTLTNNSDDEQEMSFSFSETVTHTSKFDQFVCHCLLYLSFVIHPGVPIVTEGKITVSVSRSNEFTFGTENTLTKTYTANFPVKAGPGKSVRGVSSVQEGTLEVPYTIHLASKSTGVWVETKGIWRGVSSWELRHDIRVE